METLIKQFIYQGSKYEYKTIFLDTHSFSVLRKYYEHDENLEQFAIHCKLDKIGRKGVKLIGTDSTFKFEIIIPNKIWG